MREKISLVLSWWACLHVASIAIAVADWQIGSRAIGNLIADMYLDPFSSFSEEPIVLNLPLIIWAALYVFTGSPRFLPWRKPSHTAKEG
tara:strand:+ start:498 stop:764 length:267 start_codon:yes stop_codon:yes gene_type:complete